YIQESGTGNTGWRLVPHGDGRNISSAGHSAQFSDRILTVNASAAAKSITLPPVAEAVGLTLIVVKTDVTANTVTVSPSGSETLYGGSVVLTTQYESRLFFNMSGAWFVLG